ncbi:unannotated protein [freshwater metagenome]|uniref:Unannotated protein n=1 Tax=freshwater metagenome TaxID=449393 RepID=A0A6J6PIB7_9ZZZZ
MDVTTRASGHEHLPLHGPALMACTHSSYPDFLFVGKAALRRARYVRFMCRADIWDVPGVRRAMTGMQHIPVDRQAPAAAYLTARRLLAQGEAICGFPEAGISFSYAVRSLMPGLPALARETGLPIIPIAIWGAQRIWTLTPENDAKGPGPDLTRGRVVDVTFGAPIAVPPDADLAETTTALGHVLTGMLEELQLRPEHRPAPGEHAPWYPAHLGGHAPDRREALAYDSVPHNALAPTWGPPTPDPRP